MAEKTPDEIALDFIEASARTGAKELNLNGFGLTSLPEKIGILEGLIKLKAGSFTESVSHLGADEDDDWFEDVERKNFITKLPATIGNLKNLQVLILNGNRLEELPSGMKKLNKLIELDLRNNQLPIPPEILEKTTEPQTILNYYFSLFSGSSKDPLLGLEEDVIIGKLVQAKPINEIKLLIVGQGSVGKSSLVRRIVANNFNPGEMKTDGISISTWQIGDISERESNPSKIQINIWDFGGQEIMHATHQFFLTRRSLYLLVLDARLSQEENRIEYWLKIIQSFGGESPVIIVGNKIDQQSLDIDRTGLKKKYSNVVDILETSAATGAGIEALKTAITEQVNKLPHVRDLLPETWFTVKRQLEELGRDQNFITHDRYLELCAANGINDEISQRTLIGFLHDLGVVLHFHDDSRLEALGVLNPQWVTNGVYKILNSHILFDNKGVLDRTMLDEILDFPEYPANKRLFIVDMMRKFELCYDIEPDKIFLVPDLLPKDEPFTGEWAGALAFQYHYNVLPSSIITRFIVRMEPFIHRPTTWRAGAVLKSKDNTALVTADYEDRTISIRVMGTQSTRRDFLCMIRGAFESIHKTITRIEVEAQVPHPNHPELILDHSELIEFERQGIQEFPRKVDNQVIMVNVKQLLAGVEGSPCSQVFISYAHKDGRFVKKLARDLSQAGFPVWQDLQSLEGGDIWMDKIAQSILQCKIFLVILTPDMLASEWVKKEYAYALSKRRKIVPILYKECDLPFALTNIQFVDFLHKPYEDAFSELEQTIKQSE